MQAERKGSVQVKVIHHRGKEKKEPGKARRRPPTPCLRPGGVFRFLGAWPTLASCPCPLAQALGWGQRPKREERVTLPHGSQAGTWWGQTAWVGAYREG